MSRPRLLLFDIDGTLLLSGRAGVRGLALAMERLYGQAGAMDGIEMAGRTDRAIVIDVLRMLGRDPDDAEIRRVREASRSGDEGDVKPLRDVVPVGGSRPVLRVLVAELLDVLAGEGLRLGLFGVLGLVDLVVDDLVGLVGLLGHDAFLSVTGTGVQVHPGW